jgi:HK97 family phage prohead protease
MNKSTNNYQIKGAFELKDIDLETRQVAMYVSKFGVIDSDNDMIMPGAFAKSIAERGPGSPGNRKIAFLRHHNWEKQIGKPITMEEDDNGLFVVGQLGNSTAGQDALEDYKDGIIREHSIGFKYISDRIKFIEDESMAMGGYYEINEVALWEFSAVTFGANQYTGVVDVAKTQEREDMVLDLYNQIDTVTKSLANGKGTDDRLHGLEMRLKYLNARMMDLALLTEPTIKSHSAEATIGNIKDAFDWNIVANKF